MICLFSASAHAQAQSTAGPPAQQSGGQSANVMTCTSQIGERIQCTADTSGGVALVRSRGAAPCLFGDSWGFEQFFVQLGWAARLGHEGGLFVTIGRAAADANPP